MMRWSLILKGLRRQPVQSSLAVVGILVGVSVLLFFGALAQGVEDRVLSQMISERFVEVVPRSIQLGGVQRRGGLFGGSGSGLENFTVEDLRALPQVEHVYPKQQLAFPSTIVGGGSIVGEDMYAEFVGDGIDEALVHGTGMAVDGELAFRDWAAVERCTQDSECGAGARCTDSRCERFSCTPNDELWWTHTEAEAHEVLRRAQVGAGGGHRWSVRPLAKEARANWAVVRQDASAVSLRERALRWSLPGQSAPNEDCEEGSYCDSQSRRCEVPVPVLVSPYLLELYNGSVQSVFRGVDGGMRPPRLSESALVGLSLDLRLGEGMLGRAVGLGREDAVRRTVPIRLVGFSSLAMPIGATMPRGYVERWNREFGASGAAHDYSSILVEVSHPQEMSAVVDHVREAMNLDVHPRFEAVRRAAGMVSIVLGLFSLLAVVILLVGGLHIAQTFALRALERRREFGVMRALGAPRTAIFGLVLGEAFVLGVFATALALPLTWLLCQGVDWLFLAHTPDFPFKPKGLFVWTWSWTLLSVALGTLSALLGALGPAWKVARLDAADALRERD